MKVLLIVVRLEEISFEHENNRKFFQTILFVAFLAAVAAKPISESILSDTNNNEQPADTKDFIFKEFVIIFKKKFWG
jgi:hypothetical protein